MELAATVGTPVTAPAGGRVVFAGRVPQSAGAAWRPFGTVAVVAHDATTRTVYGHLGSVRARRGQHTGGIARQGARIHHRLPARRQKPPAHGGKALAVALHPFAGQGPGQCQ